MVLSKNILDDKFKTSAGSLRHTSKYIDKYWGFQSLNQKLPLASGIARDGKLNFVKFSDNLHVFYRNAANQIQIFIVTRMKMNGILIWTGRFEINTLLILFVGLGGNPHVRNDTGRSGRRGFCSFRTKLKPQ